jgi:hypothetical protein
MSLLKCIAAYNGFVFTIAYAYPRDAAMLVAAYFLQDNETAEPLSDKIFEDTGTCYLAAHATARTSMP